MTKVSHIKKEFPILESNPHLIFADNASTTHKPVSVIEAISNYYKNSNANVHRAVYDLGVRSDEIYAETRKLIEDFYQKEVCIFTNGTTDGFNKLARSLEPKITSNCNIVVSVLEHHSNLLPWQELCKRSGATLRIARITEDGDLDIKHLAELIDENTRIVSITHISNTLGTIVDLEQVARLVENKNIYFLVDAAQSCALYKEEIARIDADAFVFGAHKMFGPSGVGAILAKKSFIKNLEPFNYGGGMVTEVGRLTSQFRSDVTKFEAGTPPIAQIAGWKAAIYYLTHMDLGQCRHYVSDLGLRLRNELDHSGIEMYGNAKRKTGILSVNFNGIHPHDAASYLNSKNIAVRAGHHCTQLIMQHYQIHSSVRFSFTIYNEEVEVERIGKAVKEMMKFFS